MQIKTKKKNADRIVRLETFGDIKEILIKEDLFDKKESKIEVCFRGHNSAGIIELSRKEVDAIYKEVLSKDKIFRNVKVMKFKK